MTSRKAARGACPTNVNIFTDLGSLMVTVLLLRQRSLAAVHTHTHGDGICVLRSTIGECKTPLGTKEHRVRIGCNVWLWTSVRGKLSG